MKNEAAAGESWQSRKSAMMRERILEAAIDWLAEHGYAGFSVLALGEKAGVTRGALQHHFPTKADLVAAVIDHVVNKRIAHFLGDFRDSASQIRDDQPQQATMLYWESVQSREYAAYIQLMVAARTDPELADSFVPGAQRYDDIWRTEMVEAFTQWERREESLQLASDFVAAAHLGLLLMNTLPDQRRQRVLDHVEQVVAQLYRDKEKGA